MNKASDIYVLGEYGRIVCHVRKREAVAMVVRGQAKWDETRRRIKLTGALIGEAVYGRTRTARSGLLAAIGRGQCYTMSERGQVTGLKRIYAEDRDTFNRATLDVLAPAIGQ